MHLGVVWIGKTRHAATAEWTAEYVERIRRWLPLTAEELTGRDPDAVLLRRAEKAQLWLLDSRGTAMAPETFTAWIGRRLTAPQATLLAIGGANGFGAAVAARAAGRIALSPLTLSHELARVVLLEQIYRALATLHHHPYPH